MKAFGAVTSSVTPLPLKDVDTDMIIPAQHLTSISREGFGQHLFSRLRASDPGFVLNNEKYKDSQILVSDSNFGCGSSREHAVWALSGAGFRVVIAKSFADIFSSNSGKNGLLLISLAPAIVDSLLLAAAQEDLMLTVDLPSQTVTGPDGYPQRFEPQRFEYDPFLKYCLVNGLDDLEYLTSQLPTIRALKSEQAKNFFFDARTVNNEPIQD
jgi:3-isopropylmalate/(R)-2-methylmalate dehydratase small subunit